VFARARMASGYPIARTFRILFSVAGHEASSFSHASNLSNLRLSISTRRESSPDVTRAACWKPIETSRELPGPLWYPLSSDGGICRCQHERGAQKTQASLFQRVHSTGPTVERRSYPRILAWPAETPESPLHKNVMAFKPPPPPPISLSSHSPRRLPQPSFRLMGVHWSCRSFLQESQGTGRVAWLSIVQ